jgi:hypothetical protein
MPDEPVNPNGYVGIDQIRAADDLGVEEINVPEWGGRVRLRQMPADLLTEFWGENFDLKEGGTEIKDRKFLTKLLARAMVGPDDKPLFPRPGEGEALLGQKSFAVVNRLALRAVELNAISDAELDGEKKG